MTTTNTSATNTGATTVWRRWSAILTSVLGAFVILVAAPAGPATLAFGVVSGLLIAVAPWIRGGARILGPLLLLLGTIPFAAYTWWSIVTPLIAVLALIAGFVALRR